MTPPLGVPTISTPVLGFFRRIVRGYFRRNFHGVRVRGADQFTATTGPLIVYANHSSWWDPMVLILLAARMMPQRRHYAPMDARALKRYKILSYLGIFGVELESARGAVQFLRTGAAALSSGGVMWITPQGKFVDTRVRPLTFKPGLAGLAARAADENGTCTVLPLAIEYTFWDERTPECLLQFGAPVCVASGDTAASVEGRFEAALLLAMDELKQVATMRDEQQFATLHQGSVGTGGFYGLGQRIKAFVTRQEYQPEHTTVRDGGQG
ncbi:lysophospholipid acyltransferase family protein [Granulicella sibirica]|uniref:Mn-containing catalase n=1 Tax=Granulicella sibirica TaxID=2479048 RepID=A0A4Q0T476_9BACT|nr:lysophospholipid acyltransferase family protein [Granulicella sibirica]RXH56789.1 Mn-containing catalase [Granulicella sibirica]